MSHVLFVMRDDGDMTEPMNIMLLSAIAEQRGWKRSLVLLERDDIVKTVIAEKPDVVAFSAITGSHKALLEANARVKNAAPSVKTVIGGPFATFRPNLIREQPFDAVGVGECDDAWPELLDAWEAGRSPDGIPNIVTAGNMSTVLMHRVFGHGDLKADQPWVVKPGHLRPRLTAMDDLPFMDRELIYANTLFKTRYKRTIMAGRGCPYRCTYCFEHSWNDMYKNKGKVLQRHSVARVCAELRDMKERWDTRFIKFYDDVFPAFSPTDDGWLDEFAETYPREVGLPFHCLIRAEMANDRVIRLLKQAGIASLTMSIEAGNAFKRDYVLLRDMSDAELRNAFALCRTYRIWTFANTILAVPAPPRPSPDDLDFDTKVDEILQTVKDVKFRRHEPDGGHLTDTVRKARETAPTPEMAREAVYRAMGKAGMRDTRLDYDREDVWYNVKLGVGFGEFPVFFPYQGTQLGGYSVKHGYFNGDYDTLHASYQTLSPLSCFTHAEKREQQNLALLGTVVLLFAGSFKPWMRACAWPATWLSVRVLAPLPFTPLYLRLYSWSKNYMHQTRVYPMGMTWRERLKNLWDNYGLDKFKQAKKNRWGIFRHRGDRPGQTLGGPPSI